MSVNEILKVLGESQRKYQRLHFSDFTKELAPKPATISNRLQLPSFFKTLFDDKYNIQVHSVSGKKYSFWHCMLYALYPNYIDKSWNERKVLVDKLIDELNHDVDQYFTLDSQIKETNMKSSEVRFQDLVPSDELIYYLSSKFNINIVLCDTTKFYFYFKRLSFNKDQPTVIFYRDDSPVFHVISIDDKILFSAKDSYFGQALEQLYAIIPEVNRVLKNHTRWPVTDTKERPEFKPYYKGKGPLPLPQPYKTPLKSKEQKIQAFVKVNNVSDYDLHKMQNEPKLKKMKVAELQALAQKFDITIYRQGKTKQVNLKKQELIDKILYHSAKN